MTRASLAHFHTREFVQKINQNLTMVDIETAVNRIVNGFKEVQRQTIMISGAKCSENIF